MPRRTHDHAAEDGRFTRRRFLAATGACVGAGLAVPAVLPASALGADGKVAPSNRIGVGMIGLGRQAIAHNLPVFARAADAQVVALCDVDRWRLEFSKENPAAVAAAKQRKIDLDAMEGCFRTTDFRELLSRKDVDAVMITTPDHWHVPIALAAIKAGKDVACEKPIGLCVAHGRILADAAARAKCVFRTDSEFRSIPTWFKAVSLVRTGKIGQLKAIRTVAPCWNTPLPMQPTMPVPPELDYDMWLGPAPLAPYTEQRVHAPKSYVAGYDRPGWYGNRTYCDGGICNWGYHPLDVAQWGNGSELTGPVEIEGRGEFPPIDGLWNVILGFDLRYRYANGVELFYTNAGRNSTSKQVHVRFEGTEGWICAWYGPDRLEAEPESLLTAQVNPEDFPFVQENEKRNFLNCVKTRERTLADAEVGHRSSSVAQLGYIACQVGRKLHWDPTVERFVGDDEANQLLCLLPGREPWNVT
ncbi:MAG: Gfo/Idh/MocA family oxidoreductase [Planctomycetes bacterium]|nr:Gfo/Idh/MocA family oxidoreductase [Planctomycetota bacterium]MBL7042855.1 Gfo/Idh/MocA family oxidoreductase [Pirellulaceae bacterium]